MNSPLDPQTRSIHEAADWYARLRGATVTPSLEHEWQTWLQASDANRQAWHKVETVCGRFDRVPGRLSVPTLGASGARRNALRKLALFAVLGAGGMLAYRQSPWREWSSDLRTATGELRDLQLADGSLLQLNTRTAVDVRFDADQRLLRLHAGEILVTTHPDPISPPRPFRVDTAHGRILALGTRFNVRVERDQTTVSVLEKAVEVSPAMQSEIRQRIEAGQSLAFQSDRLAPPFVNAPGSADWTNGSLIVVDRPLDEVLAELSRYRSGHLACAGEIADLRISGAFPLDNIDEALTALAENFPVQIEYRTRYWARVVPRLS